MNKAKNRAKYTTNDKKVVNTASSNLATPTKVLEKSKAFLFLI